MNFQEKFQKWRRAGYCMLGLLVIGWLVFISADLVDASPNWQDAQEGERLFKQHCMACHTIGKGDLVGPDLQNITQRQDMAWLKNFISQPDKVLASGDPKAQELLAKYKLAMPNLGLTEVQVQSILAYLENPNASGGQAIVALSGGQANQGQAIFSGQSRLVNGGTPCIACHSVAGIGALGGGVLGPDLTNVYGRLGDAGLSSALQGLPFPTMQGVFATRPLSTQEQENLFAFFKQADQQPVVTSAVNNNSFLGLGLIGALLLFGGMIVFWPRQRISISDTLRSNSRTSRVDKIDRRTQ